MGRHREHRDWHEAARNLLKNHTAAQVAEQLQVTKGEVERLRRSDNGKRNRVEDGPWHEVFRPHVYRNIVQIVSSELKMEACKAFAHGIISRSELSQILSGRLESPVPDPRSAKHVRRRVRPHVSRQRHVPQAGAESVYAAP